MRFSKKRPKTEDGRPKTEERSNPPGSPPGRGGGGFLDRPKTGVNDEQIMTHDALHSRIVIVSWDKQKPVINIFA